MITVVFCAPSEWRIRPHWYRDRWKWQFQWLGLFVQYIYD
jgi:hypothetical protein